MANYINQDDLIYYFQKMLRDHINENDREDIIVKAFMEQMIKFIENFPTTDIVFKNGVIYVHAKKMKIKEGAENEK